MVAIAGERSKIAARFNDGGAPMSRVAAGQRGQRHQQMNRALRSLRLTVLCGAITILVLRGSVGFNSAGGDGSSSAADDEIDRILREIRSDEDLDDRGGGAEKPTPANYTLGPKITDWDERRRRWLAEHPGFPATVAVAGGKRKPKVMLVSGSKPGPCDNPAGDHAVLKATKNKIDYCRLHGVELFHSFALLDGEMTEYWAKQPLLRRLMLSHPDVEWFWWMDSDAVFTDMAFAVPWDRYDGHNLVVHGDPDQLRRRSSAAINSGVMLLRNCQWSLDLLDAWAAKGLEGRPAFEADDQSSLIHLLTSPEMKWKEKVFVESSYYLHGFWEGLVGRYEEMMEKNHPGLGDDRWPFVTHFVGCKPCGSSGDYSPERCRRSLDRAFNFADNQVMRLYGFMHSSLDSPGVRRVRNQTATPLKAEERPGMTDKFVVRS